MAEAKKWTPGKIVLLVLGILFGLFVLCCGGLFLVARDQIMGVTHIVIDTAEFVSVLKEELGDEATFGFVPDSDDEMIVTIGVPGELTPERVVEVQDKGWKAFAKSFGDHGFVTVRTLGVGKPGKRNEPGKPGSVTDWKSNTVTTEELVARTGAAAPPKLSFVPDNVGGAKVKVDVKVTKDEDAEEEPSDESGGK